MLQQSNLCTNGFPPMGSFTNKAEITAPCAHAALSTKKQSSSRQKFYNALTKANHHQNIIGWDNYFHGYISKHWTAYHHDNNTDINHNRWHNKLLPSIVRLHKNIFNVSLEHHLKCNNKQLIKWLHRIQQQHHVSEILFSTLPPGQLTIRRAYDRKGYSTHRNIDYPT